MPRRGMPDGSGVAHDPPRPPRPRRVPHRPRVQIGTDAWNSSPCGKQADGHVQSTANGEQVTLATAGGKGGIEWITRGGGIYSGAFGWAGR